MKYKFFVYCPDDKEIIDRIIKTASKYGAGGPNLLKERSEKLQDHQLLKLK